MQRRGGFSRWELLALGTIISTVSVLLLPVLAQTFDEERADENERSRACMNNLKQVCLGLMQYQQDYDEKMPRAALAISTADHNAYGWADAVQPYIRNLEAFQCPSERHTGQNDPMKLGYTDYWLNRNMAGVEMREVRSPAMSIMLGDGDGGAANSNARYNLNTLPKGWSWRSAPNSPPLNSPPFRHSGMGVYGFADGHVKKCSYEVLSPYRPTFEVK